MFFKPAHLIHLINMALLNTQRTIIYNEYRYGYIVYLENNIHFYVTPIHTHTYLFVCSNGKRSFLCRYYTFKKIILSKMCFISSSISSTFSSSSFYYFASIVLYIITRKLIDLAQFIIYTCLFSWFLSLHSMIVVVHHAREMRCFTQCIDASRWFSFGCWLIFVEWWYKTAFLFDVFMLCMCALYTIESAALSTILFAFSILIHHHQSFTDFVGQIIVFLCQSWGQRQ